MKSRFHHIIFHKEINFLTRLKRFLSLTGFTLMELLVALAILVVILTSTLVVFRTTSSAWLKGDARTQRYQQARAVLERMSTEITSSLITRWGSICFLGETDRLFFVCPMLDTGTTDLCEVGYYLTDSSLMRHYEENPDYILSESDEDEELASAVTGLEFRYHYLLGAVSMEAEDWDSRGDQYPEDGRPDGLPRAVGIRVTVSDKARRESEDFETTVYLPMHGG